MFRKHEMIYSQHMDRPVHMWRYGHYGPPVVAFPSASGMAHEWESNGLVDALADWLNGFVRECCRISVLTVSDG